MRRRHQSNRADGKLIRRAPPTVGSTTAALYAVASADRGVRDPMPRAGVVVVEFVLQRYVLLHHVHLLAHAHGVAEDLWDLLVRLLRVRLLAVVLGQRGAGRGEEADELRHGGIVRVVRVGRVSAKLDEREEAQMCRVVEDVRRGVSESLSNCTGRGRPCVTAVEVGGTVMEQTCT